MAERFHARIGLFKGLFRTFGGPSSPTEIDLASPIQPVVDMARIAARGDYIRSSLAVSSVGASTVRDQFIFRNSLPNFLADIDPDQVDVWLTRWSMIVDLGTKNGFTVGHLAVIGGTRPPTQPTEDEPFPIASWTTDDLYEVIIGQGVGVRQDPGFTAPGSAPILLRPDNDLAGIYLVVRTNAPLTFARALFELWIGPRDATPPGLA